MIDSPVLGFLASRLYSLRTVEKMLHEAVFDLTNITPDVVQEYYRPASDPEGRRRSAFRCNILRTKRSSQTYARSPRTRSS